jgi:molybdate transport system ATP-binding protein
MNWNQLKGISLIAAVSFIARLSREFSIPILYVSHSLEEILNLAETLVLMAAGRVVAAGPIETLMNRPDLKLSEKRQNPV